MEPINLADNLAHDTEYYEVREQDRLLPIANISRIMKCALPDNAKIAKDAKECIQESVSEFVLFVTSEAAERCLQEKRKTISGEDLLWAMRTLGFDSYVETLAIYLQRFRDNGSGKVYVPRDMNSMAVGQGFQDLNQQLGMNSQAPGYFQQ